jgi:hypothetical protein
MLCMRSFTFLLLQRVIRVARTRHKTSRHVRYASDCA